MKAGFEVLLPCWKNHSRYYINITLITMIERISIRDVIVSSERQET